MSGLDRAAGLPNDFGLPQGCGSVGRDEIQGVGCRSRAIPVEEDQDVSWRSHPQIWQVLSSVPDPEIPVLSVVDLGIVRYVRDATVRDATVRDASMREAPVDATSLGEASMTVASLADDSEHGASLPAASVTPGSRKFRVGLTPTYSGCPATEVIRSSIAAALRRAGYTDVVLEEVLAPPWTSDWITQEGRRKLRAFGIAPPDESVASPRQLFPGRTAACPRCGSTDTQRLSEFGSTPCKAHYRCRSCLEPFDQFKCI